MTFAFSLWMKLTASDSRLSYEMHKQQILKIRFTNLSQDNLKVSESKEIKDNYQAVQTDKNE